MASAQTGQLELRGVHVLPGGAGFALEVTSAHQQAPLHLHFPVWTLHQLMRMLPRIDAALQQSQDSVSTALLAYPVVDWSVEASGPELGVAVCLCTDRNVESGYAFDLDGARRFQRELGEAIRRAQSPLRTLAVLSVPAATSGA